jgi:hypothetical protein
VGDEARASVTHDGETWDAKVLLETDELIVRGERRLRISFRDLRAVEAEDGVLALRYANGERTEVVLGDRAGRWAEKIRNPKTLVDKLGVKAGQRVAVVRVPDEGFRRELAARVGSFVDDEPANEVDVVFLGAESLEDLATLETIERSLARDGAVWVVAPKGGREPREADVLAAGKRAGLVDTKVARFSDTHTAHRFVIPAARR